jgi:NAD(P)-dependent dehydrogenase (short-subunit alcohol dehydrogenase family)
MFVDEVRRPITIVTGAKELAGDGIRVNAVAPNVTLHRADV